MKISASNKCLFDTAADIYIVPVFKDLKKQFTTQMYGGLAAKINALYNTGAINEYIYRAMVLFDLSYYRWNGIYIRQIERVSISSELRSGYNIFQSLFVNVRQR